MLTRKVFNFSKLEEVEGTPAVTSPLDDLGDPEGFLSYESTVQEPGDEIDIQPGSTSLSREATLMGMEVLTLGYRTLFRGGASLDTDLPEWDRHFRSAGMKRTMLNYLWMGDTGSDTFLHGETIAFVGGAGAVATVVRDTLQVENGALFYELVSGTPAVGDTVTGATSGATTNVGATYLEMDTTGSGTFTAGETINFAASGAVGTVIRNTAYADGAKLFYALVSGVPADTDTVTGAASGATTDIASGLEAETGGAAEAGGYKWQPVSIIASSVSHVAWAAAEPAAGDVVQKNGANDVWGVVAETPANAATTLIYEPTMGAFASGDTLNVVTGEAAGQSVLLNGDPVLVWQPTTTEEIRQDGMTRQAQGCRSTITIEAQSGQPILTTHAVSGIFLQRGSVAMGSPNISTDDPVVFRNAKVRFRDYTTSPILDLRFKTSQFQLATNNTLSPETDPEEAKGALSFRIRGRDPQITIDPNMVVPAIFDYYGRLKARTLVGMYVELPAGTARRPLCIYAGKVQFTEVTDGDREGQHTAAITGRPTKVGGAGDDEFAIYQT